MEIRNSRDVATYIKLRRGQLNMSQETLARRAGVSRSWLAEVESGKPTAEVGKILKLANALGIEISVAARTQPAAKSIIDELINDQRSA